MPSKVDATKAFVWMWLPGETEPVVAGRLDQDGERLLFTYGASYRRRKNAIPIYEPELPLRQGAIPPINGLPMASCIRDGSPDAWGRRVILNRLTGKRPDAAGVPEISELTYLLQAPTGLVPSIFRHRPQIISPALLPKLRSTNSWKQPNSSKRVSRLPPRSTRPSIMAPRSAVRAPRRLSMTARRNSSPNSRRATTHTAS